MVNVKASLPIELISLLSESVTSVAIKGTPGLARTVFSLNILERIISMGGTAYFFTPTVKKERFLLNYPWLSERKLDSYILDFSDLHLEMPLKLGLPPKDFSSLNSFFDLFSTRNEKPSVLILDSINYLKNKLGLAFDDISLEDYLLHHAYNRGISLILCYEATKELLSDALFDVIITLKKYYVAGRIMRELILEKIAGTELTKNIYLFSVIKGTMYHFRESNIMLSSLKIPPQRIDYTSKSIPTAISELDHLLGGYPIGSLNLIYCGPNVGRDYRWLVVPTLANLILNRYPVFIIPSVATPYEDIEKWFVPSVSESLFRKYLYIFEITPEEKYEENVIKLQGQSLLFDSEIVFEMIDRVLQRTNAALFGIFIGTDTLEFAYGIKDFKKHFGAFVRDIVNRNGVAFLINKTGQQTTKSQLNYAHTHFRLVNYLGTILLCGERPFTPFYAIIFDENKKQVDLVPIK